MDCSSYKEAFEVFNVSLNIKGLDYLNLMIIHSLQPWPHVGIEDRF